MIGLVLTHWRLLAEFAGAVALAAALTIYHHHVYELGVTAVHLADAAAYQKAQAAADLQTQALQAKADSAAQEASHARSDYDAYVARYPLGPVRLCINAARRAVPESSDPRPAGAGATAAAGTGPGVPGGSPGPGYDLRPDLESIVRGFAVLAIQVRELQSAVTP